MTEGTRHEASDRGDAAPHPDEWRYFNRAELIGGDFLRHQREGITWLRTKQRSLLCDGTGVGKTVQALGAIALSLAAAENTAETPCLIVVPASLGPQWRKEMTRFLSPEVPVRHMDDDPAKLGPKQAARIHRQPPPWIEVVSYDTLAHRLDSYVGRRYGLVVLDEVGKVRGGGKLSQAARLVTLTASRVIGMTATPVENNTAETFEILHVLNLASELFGTRAAFYERFVDLKEFDGEWKVAGSLNVAEFAEIVAPYVLRRTIRDIGAQTPARVGPHEVMVPLGPAQTAAYAEACALPRGLKRFRAQEQATDFVVLPDGSYESARVAEAVRFIEATDEKVIVGTNSLALLDVLERELDSRGIGSVTVEGNVDPKTRGARIEKFRTDGDCQVLLGSSVLTHGLNLAFCRNFVSLGGADNPAVEKQREGRVGRIGGLHSTYVYLNVWTDTDFDNDRRARLAGKADVASVVLAVASAEDANEPVRLVGDSPPTPSQMDFLSRLAKRVGVDAPDVRHAADVPDWICVLEAMDRHAFAAKNAARRAAS